MQLTTSPSIEWTDTFLLGYPALDSTHREFVERLSALQRAADNELTLSLGLLTQHLIEHFEQEQKWMESSEFPATDCHVREHEALLQSLRDVNQEFLKNADAALVKRFAQALAEWFPAHADYMDAPLAHWLAKQVWGGAPVVLKRSVAHPLSG